MENPPNRDDTTEADALRRLEDRLARATDAAERLMAEAAGAAARAAAGAASGEEPETPPKPPPSGWQAPGSEGPIRTGDVELLSQFIHSLRDLIPPELQQRLAQALRELLLALRALIDWYIERLERRRAQPVEVQDIPIL